jgi:hypothetical protein
VSTRAPVHPLLEELAALGIAAVFSWPMCPVAPRSTPYLTEWLARLEQAGMSRRFATNDPEGQRHVSPPDCRFTLRKRRWATHQSPRTDIRLT